MSQSEDAATAAQRGRWLRAVPDPGTGNKTRDVRNETESASTATSANTESQQVTDSTPTTRRNNTFPQVNDRNAATSGDDGPASSVILPPDPEVEARALAEITRARSELPARDETMFDTYLGTLVRHISSTSEADPANILASLLAGTGVYLGGRPHIRTGDDRHPLLVWPLIIGRTGIGRKGAGWAAARRLLAATDPEFVLHNIHSGLTSGEGLSQAFTADEEDDQAATGPDEDAKGRSKGDKPRARLLPAGDRRLLAFEPEWAAVMARMKREGNTLSATMRSAWEGSNLSTLGITARLVRDTHIGILAHITPGEFNSKVNRSDLAGGTYNRFLPVFVAQTRFLPGGTGADPALLDRLAVELRARLAAGATLGQLRFTQAAEQDWRGLYVEFGSYSAIDGPVEQFLSRAAPNCLRVAGIHAVLDGRDRIDTPHLAAAAAFVRYAVDSARAIFGSTTSALLAFIAAAEDQGRTRTEISGSPIFGGKASKEDIDAELNPLIEKGEITVTSRPRSDGRTSGRQAQVYVATRRN